jgi:hypothetical protein
MAHNLAEARDFAGVFSALSALEVDFGPKNATMAVWL